MMEGQVDADADADEDDGMNHVRYRKMYCVTDMLLDRKG